LLGVGANVVHVLLNSLKAIILYDYTQMSISNYREKRKLTGVDELNAFMVSCNLLPLPLATKPHTRMDTYRLEITLHVPYIPAPRTSRVLCWLINHILQKLFPIVNPAANDLERYNLCAFFEYIDRCRRHGSWQYTTDISMVPSRRSKEDDLVVIENGGNDGDIW
jgi:hypothetical protein